MKKILSLLAVALFASRLAAAVITDTNIVLGSGEFFGDYALTIYQDEAATDPTSIFFNLEDGILTITDYNVDEASDWYLVHEFDYFSSETISAGDFPTWIRHTPVFENNPLFVGTGDFYLGVNTGNIAGGPPFPPRNIFGWVKLNSDGESLFMLGNAVAYNEGGIVVGVPEPSTYALIGLGVLSIVAVRRCRKN